MIAWPLFHWCDMTMALDFADALLKRRTNFIFDDFNYYVSTDLWTTQSGSTGTTAYSGTYAQGTVLLTTAATSNDEQAIALTNTPFLIAAGKPLIFEARISFTNQATTNACIGVGFASTPTTVFPSGGGDPTQSMTAALIYKRKGDTTYSTISQVGTTTATEGAQRSNLTATTAAGTWDTLRIEIEPVSSTIAEVRYFGGNQTSNSPALPFGNVPGSADLQPLLPSTGYPFLQLKDHLTYTSAVAFTPVVVAHAGSANAQLCYVDYIFAAQLR